MFVVDDRARTAFRGLIVVEGGKPADVVAH